MKEHLGSCSFGEKITEEVKIDCLHISCGEKFTMGEMLDHLKNIHKSCEHPAYRKVNTRRWLWPLDLLQSTSLNWTPEIASYKNQTFLLHAHVRDHTWWVFLVTLLGREEEAKKYEVKMSIRKKAGQHFSMEFRGKVFGTEEPIKDILKDSKNGLRLINSLAHVNENGEPNFTIEYQIICKKKANSNSK